jgi:hypothetical protein
MEFNPKFTYLPAYLDRRITDGLDKSLDGTIDTFFLLHIVNLKTNSGNVINFYWRDRIQYSDKIILSRVYV